MKALVKKEAGKGIWLQDVPEPEPGINDVPVSYTHLRAHETS